MNNDVGLEIFVDNFSKSINSSFSVDDIKKELLPLKIKVSKEDIISILDSNPQIISLYNCQFIHKVVFFENYLFSIFPTKYEVVNKIMIIGHRCVPFVDFEKPPHEIEFFFNNEKIPKKTFEMQTSFVYDFYSLFGEEYISQYWESDIANENKYFLDDPFSLPTKIKLTVLDMSKVYEMLGFNFGDRFLCKVFDRFNLSVSLEFTKNEEKNPFKKTTYAKKQEKWYENFEKYLCKIIKYYGPCCSIDEQLMFLFFSGKTLFSNKFAGSTEEFLRKSNKFDFELFGIERRIWFKKETIPLVGNWNKALFYTDDDKINFNFVFGNPLTEGVIISFFLDSFFTGETDKTALFDRIIPKKNFFTEETILNIIVFFEKEYLNLKKNYNKFADFDRGTLRHQTLNLYAEIFSFICDIADTSIRLTSLPTQQIVILSQLFSHVNQIIEALLQSDIISDEELQSFAVSVESMEFTFQDIYEELVASIENQQSKNFFIVKKREN
ncbi:MAG: hypothetical protein ACRC5H_01475 [Treponemataceae bacterium]